MFRLWHITEFNLNKATSVPPQHDNMLFASLWQQKNYIHIFKETVILNCGCKRLQQQNSNNKFTGLNRQLKHLSYNILQVLSGAFWDRWRTPPSLHKEHLKGRQGVNKQGNIWGRDEYLQLVSVLPHWKIHLKCMRTVTCRALWKVVPFRWLFAFKDWVCSKFQGTYHAKCSFLLCS